MEHGCLSELHRTALIELAKKPHTNLGSPPSAYPSDQNSTHIQSQVWVSSGEPHR